MIIDRMAARIEDGKFKIKEMASKIEDLLEEKELTESVKRMKSNQKKIEEKNRQNQFLYLKDKSFETVSEDEHPHNILSVERHKEFVR
jgi:hypothetical protein